MPIIELVDFGRGELARVAHRAHDPIVSQREFENGWLTFESPTGRKRPTPVLARWDAATPKRLELMCRDAIE